MAEHKLFYYPYASLTNQQLPILKVAALYFDKLVILDPVGASWDAIGADYFAREAVTLLEKERILEVVTPGAVLATFDSAIADAIRRDMADPDFKALCDAHVAATGKRTWTLSLAKAPQDLVTDQAMRRLMSDTAQKALADSARRKTVAQEYVHYDETDVGAIIDQAIRLRESASDTPEVPIYDEYRESYDGSGVEYRWAPFPLALGEAIMMNHALFTGVLHSDATPITDDPFHSQALAQKLRRAKQEPKIQQAMLDRAKQRSLKVDAFAAAALADKDLKLPILHPAVSLEEVLEYRRANPDALGKVRDALGQMARRVKAEPWTEAFAEEIETQTVPDLIKDLREAQKARDAWLETPRGKNLAKFGTMATGAAAAVLTVVTAPITPVALAIGALSVASAAALPGVEWLADWYGGRSSKQENGLHYLLRG